MLLACSRRGARGYVLSRARRDELLKAISRRARAPAANSTKSTRACAAPMRTAPGRQAVPRGLRRRGRRLLRLVARGTATREKIAARSASASKRSEVHKANANASSSACRGEIGRRSNTASCRGGWAWPTKSRSPGSSPSTGFPPIGFNGAGRGNLAVQRSRSTTASQFSSSAIRQMNARCTQNHCRRDGFCTLQASTAADAYRLATEMAPPRSSLTSGLEVTRTGCIPLTERIKHDDT
jgi:hypothetical protein